MTNFPKTQSALTAIASGAASATPDKLAHDKLSSYQLARTIAAAADDRKGADIVLLDVAEVSYLADYFVVVTGFSNVQVRAIARSIEDQVQEQLHRLPLRHEGQAEGSWVLIDYGDVIAHIFLPQEREFYNLEAFWGHAQRIPFSVSQSARDSIH